MIDSVKTKGMSLKDASKLIKGELGTVVELTIYRPSARKKIIFELTNFSLSCLAMSLHSFELLVPARTFIG